MQHPNNADAVHDAQRRIQLLEEELARVQANPPTEKGYMVMQGPFPVRFDIDAKGVATLPVASNIGEASRFGRRRAIKLAAAFVASNGSAMHAVTIEVAIQRQLQCAFNRLALVRGFSPINQS